MSRKKPTLYLTNGKKHRCTFCKCDLIKQEREFQMLQIKGQEPLTVKEYVLFCPSCKKHFITQSMSCQLLKRYPGYYVDASDYNLKPAKPKKNTIDTDGTPKSSAKQNGVDSLFNHTSPENISVNKHEQNSALVPVAGIDAEISLSKHCNLIGLHKDVYIIPFEFQYCPVCGNRLNTPYNYAVQFSEKECVRTVGCECRKCKAFFTKYESLFEWLENQRLDKSAYTLHKEFAHCDAWQTKLQYRKKESALLQVTVCSSKKNEIYTVVTDIKDIDMTNHVYSYKGSVGWQIIRAVMLHHTKVDINNTLYTIVSISFNETADERIVNEIDKCLREEQYEGVEVPSISDEHMIYIYKGKLNCHENHILKDVAVSLDVLGKPNARFYAQYCYDCQRFIMNYYDYKEVLKKYRVFPFPVQLYSMEFDDWNRAEKSPLRLMGYTVSAYVGYTDRQRQQILECIMKSGALDKRRILDYIEMFIREREYQPDMELAVFKWEKDKEFVLDYELDQCINYRVTKIVRWS